MSLVCSPKLLYSMYGLRLMQKIYCTVPHTFCSEMIDVRATRFSTYRAPHAAAPAQQFLFRIIILLLLLLLGILLKCFIYKTGNLYLLSILFCFYC